ncbi:hypothetical protein [Caballeronia telluris]|jgi:hypothetical protein|uniref:Uncharacterized protein n=1 Tax=Caballeronia telluris TaxID=326475 RepID=A0A158H8Y6_9BURK|nr:hypothetical protein [Caballeronia telluris]SAL40597.1 hypothetical protein AWB66_02082 [Caballeronia telluris]
MQIESTDWFPLDQYAPVRDGWYEVQLTSGATAFSKFIDGQWTETPALTFTHWRGLSADPALSGEPENIDAEATAAEGVRAVWNAFFPAIADDPKQGEAHRKDA